MEVTGHTSAPAELAAALVNRLTPGARRGQPFAGPSGSELRAAVTVAVEDRPNRARAWTAADDAEHARVVALAERWRAVFRAADDGGPDAVAPLVNALLAEAPVQPVLADHDGEPWHLHAHPDDAGPADGLAAICALGLAGFVADGGAERLGTCAASACDRVYVDTSRNASRRFCSTACQGRAKTAAFRARKEQDT